MFIIYNFDKILRRLHHTFSLQFTNGANRQERELFLYSTRAVFLKTTRKTDYLSYFLSHSERFSRRLRITDL